MAPDAWETSRQQLDGPGNGEDADGNRVNLGNFDRDGLNVNANHPGNDWNNIGLLLSS